MTARMILPGYKGSLNMDKNQEDAFSSEFMDFTFNCNLPRVYRRVCAMVPQAEAVDVTQDVFMSLLRSLPNFKGDPSFSTWVNNIIKGGIVDYYRRSSWISRPLTEQEEIENASGKHRLQAGDEFARLTNELAMLAELPQPALRSISSGDFKDVVSRLLDEQSFRENFYLSPVSALRNTGFHLSPVEIAVLEEMEPESLAEWFSGTDERAS